MFHWNPSRVEAVSGRFGSGRFRRIWPTGGSKSRYWLRRSPEKRKLSDEFVRNSWRNQFLRSHSPRKYLRRMAGSTGLEPAASAVTGQRSNQLNYDPAFVCFKVAETLVNTGDSAHASFVHFHRKEPLRCFMDNMDSKDWSNACSLAQRPCSQPNALYCSRLRGDAGDRRLLSRSATSALSHHPIVLLFIGYRTVRYLDDARRWRCGEGQGRSGFLCCGRLEGDFACRVVVKLTSEAAPELLKRESFSLTKEKLGIGLTGEMRVASPNSSRARIVAPQ